MIDRAEKGYCVKLRIIDPDKSRGRRLEISLPRSTRFSTSPLHSPAPIFSSLPPHLLVVLLPPNRRNKVDLSNGGEQNAKLPIIMHFRNSLEEQGRP